MKFDLTLMEQGGLLMWPLVLLSFFGFVIFVERLLFLHKGQIRTNAFIDGIKNLLEKGRLLEALTVCEETPGPVVAIVKAALLNASQGEEKMRMGIQAAALVEIPALERRVGTMALIARVAPLLGLLGTVVGILQALYGMQSEGAYAHVGTLSGGFAQALVTTALGLAISAMAHLSFHFLHGRVRALVQDMEYAGQEMLQLILLEKLLQNVEGLSPLKEENEEQ